MIKDSQKNNFLSFPLYMSGAIIQQYHGAEAGAEHAYEHGYTHWYIDGANKEDRPSEWSSERIKNMRNKIQELGVSPVFHGNFKAPLASDVPELRKAALEYLKTEIDLSAELGAPVILHGGGIVEPRSVKEAIEQALEGYVETIQEAMSYAQSKGVELWLENLSNYQRFHPFYYVFTNIKHYRYVLDRVPGIKMIFDVCHETVGGGDPLAVFNELHDRIAAFSFSDTDGTRDSHWPLGKGKIDWNGLTKCIVEKDWHGLVAFETRNVEPKENIQFVNALYDSNVLPENAVPEVV
ncbi:sugar phosphate isomerase/epimerase [Alteromonas sp. a30]|nr:sugar phosphate isomerase/epimerase [Alteromonas sp. a30]